MTDSKLNKWAQQGLLTPAQKEKIAAFEDRENRPFRLLAVMWLGIFICCLGGTALMTAGQNIMPDWAKLSAAGIAVLIGIGATIYGFRRERHLLFESALFFCFLAVGGGIGLIAQVFNLPVGTGMGLLAWAGLSLIIVLFSERELLGLLWVPLFLGGILGYVRLEFLFLFLAQAPALTVAVSAAVLLMSIALTDGTRLPFLRALNRWLIVLFYGILVLGEMSQAAAAVRLILTVGALAALAGYALYRHRTRLYNLTLFLIALRFMWLTGHVFQYWPAAGGWLLGLGVLILAGTGVLHFMPPADKP